MVPLKTHGLLRDAGRTRELVTGWVCTLSGRGHVDPDGRLAPRPPTRESHASQGSPTLLAAFPKSAAHLTRHAHETALTRIAHGKLGPATGRSGDWCSPLRRPMRRAR